MPHMRDVSEPHFICKCIFLAPEFGLDPGVLTSVFFFFFASKILQVFPVSRRMQAPAASREPRRQSIVLSLEDPKSLNRRVGAWESTGFAFLPRISTSG